MRERASLLLELRQKYAVKSFHTDSAAMLTENHKFLLSPLRSLSLSLSPLSCNFYSASFWLLLHSNDLTGVLDTKLQRAFNSCLRFVRQLRRDQQHVTPYRIQENWLSVRHRRLYSMGTLLYDILQTHMPAYLAEMFVTSPPSIRTTRVPRDRLVIPLCRTEIYKPSFTVQAAYFWNSLPNFNWWILIQLINLSSHCVCVCVCNYLLNLKRCSAVALHLQVSLFILLLFFTSFFFFHFTLADCSCSTFILIYIIIYIISYYIWLRFSLVCVFSLSILYS